MTEKPPIYSNMNLVDWLLAAVFTAVVATLAQRLFPPYGWAVGVVIALVLLYLAKRRRDQMQRPDDER